MISCYLDSYQDVWILTLTGPYKCAPGQIVYIHIKNNRADMEKEKENDKDRYYPDYTESLALQSLWSWLENIITKQQLRLVCGYSIAVRLRYNKIINVS